MAQPSMPTCSRQSCSFTGKLRTATDPTIDPESEQVKSWVGQAWAAADGDKSGKVSKDELTGFLSRGA